MAEEPFQKPSIKCALRPEERFSMALISLDNGETIDANTVRKVLDAGLTALGFPPERRVKEYSEYVIGCIQGGQENKFEKARS